MRNEENETSKLDMEHVMNLYSYIPGHPVWGFY